MKPGYLVTDEALYLWMERFHTQVLPFYPQYDPNKPSPEAERDYRKSNNSVGHQQRGFLCYYAIKSFVEQGIIGIDLGSAGVVTPMCLATDAIPTGSTPAYGGVMQGVQMAVDASDLSMFGTETFGCVLSNHLTEHLPCLYAPKNISQRERLDFDCPGWEVVDVFDEHWLRVVKKGGYVCGIIPDEQYAREVNSSTLFYDETHQHRLDPNSFRSNILERLKTPVEILEFDTFQNNFSFNFVLRKK